MSCPFRGFAACQMNVWSTTAIRTGELDGLSLSSKAVAPPRIFCLRARAAATAANQEDAMTSHPLVPRHRRREHSIPFAEFVDLINFKCDRAIDQVARCFGIHAGANDQTFADQSVVHRHSSRSSVSRRPPRSSRDHPKLSAIGDMITPSLWADPTLSVADTSAHGPKEARARDQSPLRGPPQMTDRPAIRDHLLAATPLSRAESGCGGKLPQRRASAS